MTEPIESTAAGEPARRSPAAHQAALVREVLEDVLLEAARLPGRVDRRPVVRDLEAALAAVTALSESDSTDAGHLDKLDRAHAAVRCARETLAGHDHGDLVTRLAKRLFGAQRALEHCRGATIDSVVAHQQTAARQRPPAIADATPLMASVGAPRLHSFAREPLGAGAEVAPPDEWVFDEDGGGDEPMQPDHGGDPLALGAGADTEERAADDGEPPGPEPDAARRLQVLSPLGETTGDPVMVAGRAGEVAQLERIARDCLEDIGVLGNLRIRGGREPFDLAAVARFEQRLLDDLDALVGLGMAFETTAGAGAPHPGFGVLEHVLAWSRDVAAPDPGRAFARALVLGSVAGTDTVRAAVLALKQSHPLTYDMQAGALALAPHPGIDAAMSELCADDDPRLCALALTVLARRDQHSVAAVLPLLDHSSAPVRAAAVRCLGGAVAVGSAPAPSVGTGERPTTHPALIELLADLGAREPDDEAALAVIESLLGLGSATGVRMARERIDDVLSDPGDLLPSTSDRLLLLLGMAGGAEDAERLARAYHGRADGAAALGRHGHVSLVPTLLAALDDRGSVITGPEGRHAAAQALQRITGAARLPDGEAAAPDRDELPIDPAFWQAWWSEHHQDFDPAIRYRLGQPYTALSAVAELERDLVAAAERERSAFELGLLRYGPRIRVDDWLARQQRRIELAREAARIDLASGAPRLEPGGWALAVLS